jgi:nucleoside-diphosphate-sugar epimerase
VSVVESDVANRETLKMGLEGVDVVVHTAGVVDPFGSYQSIFAVNVEGTRNVLEVAKTLQVRQFVYVSSLSVITGNCDQYEVSENAPLTKCGEAYADSKIEAEQLVMACAKEGEMAVTSVRPGFIYGARERSWLPRLINSIANGKAVLIGGGRKQTNVIYVENLNRAIEATFFNPKAYGQVYNLTDGEMVSKKQLFDAVADGLGLPRVTRLVPTIVARTFCQFISRVAPFLPIASQKRLARYSKAAFRLAGLNQGFSIAKAEKELGYLNRIPFKDGMAATLTYFQMPAKSEDEKSAGLMKLRQNT